MRFKVAVEIRLKPGVLDPQGQAVQAALRSLGYESVREVGVGKTVRFSLEAADLVQAKHQVEEMCRQLLANPVMEQYAYQVADSEALGVEQG